MPTFIGIDLAWQPNRNHSGCVVLHGNQEEIAVQNNPSWIVSLNEVATFIEQHAENDTVVAIDAPLIIQNKFGQRPCETEISRRFWAAHASAHSSNLTLYPSAGGVRLARHLESHGFRHCPRPHEPERHLSGKWFFEVYPHSAHVILFNRSRIIKYKKGTVASRRTGLHEFRGCLRNLSGPRLKTDSMLQFLECPRDLDNLRGLDLKHYEDILDATLCAYLAAYFWAWGYDRNEPFGTYETGYIINPKKIH